MIIKKMRLCLADIEAFVNSWGWYIVDDMENGEQAAAEHVGLIIQVS